MVKINIQETRPNPLLSTFNEAAAAAQSFDGAAFVSSVELRLGAFWEAPALEVELYRRHVIDLNINGRVITVNAALAFEQLRSSPRGAWIFNKDALDIARQG